MTLSGPIRYRGDGREPTAADAGEFLKAQSDWTVLGKDFREKVGMVVLCSYSLLPRFFLLPKKMELAKLAALAPVGAPTVWSGLD